MAAFRGGSVVEGCAAQNTEWTGFEYCKAESGCWENF